MLITTIVFILTLGFLVLVHELGHFFAAKKFSMSVEEFGIGFPPSLYQKKRGETVYSINLIPIGGYVKIKGEDGSSIEEGSFSSKPTWQRAIVVLSGVAMNIIAGTAIFIFLFSTSAPVEITKDIDQKYILKKQILVTEVVEKSPSEEAGIKIGDEIIEINGEKVSSIEFFQNQIAYLGEKEIEIKIKRSKEEFTLQAKPRIIEEIENKRPLIGVSLSEMGNIRLPIHKAIIYGIKSSGNYLVKILEGFYGIIKKAFSGGGMEELGGPVAIAVMTGDAINLGFEKVILFAAILSFNLAVLNILPFPALDGGRLVFLAIEAVRRKPSKKEVEEWFHRIGFTMLILFAIFITYKDVVKFGGKFFGRVIG